MLRNHANVSMNRRMEKMVHDQNRDDHDGGRGGDGDHVRDQGYDLNKEAMGIQVIFLIRGSVEVHHPVHSNQNCPCSRRCFHYPKVVHHYPCLVLNYH